MRFLELCSQITCIEDLIVLSYGFIYNEFTSIKEHKYIPENHIELQEALSVYFERIEYDKVDAIREVKENIIKLYSKCSFNFFDFYCIIRTIDLNYIYKTNCMNMGFEKFNKYSTLSLKFDEADIILIPKNKNCLIDIFEKTLKKSEKENGEHNTGLRLTLPYDKNNINAYLDNFILIHKDDIKNKLIINEYISSKYDKNNIITNIQQRKSIRIAMIPVMKKTFDEIFDYQNDDKYFWINKINEKEEEQIIKLYINVIEKYKNIDVDFIVFPELFLNKNIMEKVKKYIDNTYIEKSQIYVLGSVWEDFCNKVVIMTSDGEIVCEQYKKIPFEKNGLEEKILQENDIINVLDFTGVGRINIFICRDITDDKLMSIPKIIGTNLIIAPAYSESLNMKQVVKGLASNNFCTTVLVNSCSARYDKNASNSNKKIGFICQHLKNITESDSIIFDYKFSVACKYCNCDCYGFLAEMKYDEIYNPNVKTFSTKIEKIV